MKRKYSDEELMCRFCEHSVPLYDDESMLCRLRGIVGKTFICKKFEYDPLKRAPSAAPKAPSLEFVDIEKD